MTQERPATACWRKKEETRQRLKHTFVIFFPFWLDVSVLAKWTVRSRMPLFQAAQKGVAVLVAASAGAEASYVTRLEKG